ncbi:MAG TPA: hypothetical protein VGN17_01075 [Bryobacteraceae bacterium]|jgi:hypothetical protein
MRNLILALIVIGGAARAESFVALYSGKLYLKCVGGAAAATSQFGLGTSTANFVPLLNGLPGACPTAEVFAANVSAGQAVQFGIYTSFSGQNYYAFSAGTDRGSIVAFSDTDGSLGMGGKIIQQTGPTTWVMHLDDAASYLIDDNDSDILMQIRLEASPSPTPSILPQFAFGGGWYSAIYFTNTSASAVSFPVNFIGDDGKPLAVPALGGSTVRVNLAPRGTVVLEAPNVGPLSQGYASVALPTGVTGYAVFRQSIGGIPDQEAVVQLSGASATTSTLVWDDTLLTTAVALVNLSSLNNAVSVTVWDSHGNQVASSSVFMPPNAKSALALRDLPGLSQAIIGNRGSADFSVAFGNLAVLGLRFDGAAFTSIPTTDK